jgi:hypothetical protein
MTIVTVVGSGRDSVAGDGSSGGGLGVNHRERSFAETDSSVSAKMKYDRSAPSGNMGIQKEVKIKPKSARMAALKFLR